MAFLRIHPTVLGRKSYKYRQPAGELKTISTRTSNKDWPFPDTYFKSIGCTVRGFSFLFPNASDMLKENLLPSEYLLSIESGTETIFFPPKKIKIKYNGVLNKYFVKENYFLYDKSNIMLYNCPKQKNFNIWFIQLF